MIAILVDIAHDIGRRRSMMILVRWLLFHKILSDGNLPRPFLPPRFVPLAMFFPILVVFFD
jgi:hypothetical protein